MATSNIQPIQVGNHADYLGHCRASQLPTRSRTRSSIASGASWVSVHHGGGVGIGNSIHAGLVIVADGSEEMDERLSRVLTNDPGIGVARHADAGYEEAVETAHAHALHLPMERIDA